MKLKIIAVLLVALLMLSGCSVRETVRTLDAAEDAVEQRIDQAEDAVENAIRDAVQPAPPAAKPEPTAAPEPAAVPEPTAASPATDKLSPEKAQEIALAHAGFTAGQVEHLWTEFEYDDRIPQYDVSFREGRWEYEYEIHAETGEILSWEKDD